MYHNCNNQAHNRTLDLSDKIEALFNTYRLARRYVLGLYGYKGEADTNHPYHYLHPERIESEILCYAGVLAGENGGFWSTDIYHSLFVLDRLNEYEIYTEQMEALYKEMTDRDPKGSGCPTLPRVAAPKKKGSK